MSQEINGRLSGDSSCSTSTPVIRANSRNSQLITLRKRRTHKDPLTLQNISVSDCQVFVEPIKLTPEQYEAARLSINDSNSSRGNSFLTLQSVKESIESDLLPWQSLSHDGSNTSTQNQEKSKSKVSRISSNGGSTAGLIRDCVVSLEKLRLSPLILQEGRKRLSTSSISGVSSCVFNDSSDGDYKDVSMPSTPRKQASHMSFVVRVFYF
jgi:hypothetical protein